MTGTINRNETLSLSLSLLVMFHDDYHSQGCPDVYESGRVYRARYCTYTGNYTVLQSTSTIQSSSRLQDRNARVGQHRERLQSSMVH
jgi:hypothetical protein